MKILFTKEISECNFILSTVETNHVFRSCGDLVGKTKDGESFKVNMDNIVKITE